MTNHAYLVTRLEDNPEFVSDRLLIIDEVQKILLALENLLQETYDIQSIIDLIDKALVGEENRVQQRILESIRFECLYLIEQFQSGKSRKNILDSLDNLHQYFSELEVEGFDELVRYFTAEGDYWLEVTETSQRKFRFLLQNQAVLFCPLYFLRVAKSWEYRLLLRLVRGFLWQTF